MKKLLATVSVGTLMVLALPGVANAKAGDVRVNGKCTASSTSKMKLKTDNGRIETDFEVDQNRVGQKWSVFISDNGTVVVRGTAITTAPSGSFEFRRLIPNRAGTDRVKATAKNAATGEVCSAVASI